LSRYFQSKPEVKKGYVALLEMPKSSEPAHLLFSIEVDGDFRPIASDLGVIFQETLETGQFADLVQFGQGSLDDYFRSQQPFFKR
jgi:hypothetical protein